jgi:hypothetical protein
MLFVHLALVRPASFPLVEPAPEIAIISPKPSSPDPSRGVLFGFGVRIAYRREKSIKKRGVIRLRGTSRFITTLLNAPDYYHGGKSESAITSVLA